MTGRFIAGVGIGVTFLLDDVTTASDPSAGFYILAEDGSKIVQEDGSGEIVQETAP